MTRIYGNWAGDPAGRKEDPALCVEAVWPFGAPGGAQCSRKRGHGPNGDHCKQHGKVAEKWERIGKLTNLKPSE